MRKTLLYIVFISSGACCNNSQQQAVARNSFRDSSSRHRIPGSMVFHHLNILDSAARTVTRDTMYHCCGESVAFIEACTGIEADIEGDYFGATGLKNHDLPAVVREGI